MNITGINLYSAKSKFENQNKSISFSSASDISIKYLLEKRAKYLPERIKNKITESLIQGGEMKKFYELHRETYEPLMQAKTLNAAKLLYPEFSDVLELTVLANNRSKAIKSIRAKMPLEEFSLDLLKKLYAPQTEDSIVKDYNLTNRSLLRWLYNKLHIKKLDGAYLQLLNMSDEAKNARIGELTRQALLRDPETQKKRLAKAAAHHKTPEYRAKKKQEMINFYKRNPQMAEKVRMLSLRTWELCPDIKAAFSEYAASLTPYIKSILSKKQFGKPLSEKEQRMVRGCYKTFWDSHPNLRKTYSEARKQAAIELGMSTTSVG